MPPVPGKDAEGDLGKADFAGALQRDADVGRHRDLQTAADGVAVQRGDDELRRLLEAVERLVRVEAEVVLELRRDLGEHLDVRAGGEELVARAAQHDDVDVVVHARVEDARHPAPCSFRRCRCWRGDRSARRSPPLFPPGNR